MQERMLLVSFSYPVPEEGLLTLYECLGCGMCAIDADLVNIGEDLVNRWKSGRGLSRWVAAKQGLRG